MFAALEALRDALALAPTLVAAAAADPPTGSCEIGFEANISPASFPLVRLVPSRIVPGRPYANRTAEVLLYFGAPLAAASGMPEVYEALLALEAELLAILRAEGVRYVETITDEDRLTLYKLMAIRCEMQAQLAA